MNNSWELKLPRSLKNYEIKVNKTKNIYYND